jgi:hypothetical protein
VGRWQLVELGFGDEAIRVALASGRLHPLHREAYAVGHRIVVKRGKWLAAVLAMGRGRRRARAALRPLLLAEQRYVEDTASPLEDRFAAFVVDHRLPPPTNGVMDAFFLLDQCSDRRHGG